LSASCTSGFWNSLLILFPFFRVLSYALFTSALLSLLYWTLGRSRRHLLEKLCFAFPMQRSPVYWLPRGLKRFSFRYLGKYYAKLRSAGGMFAAFRRRVTMLYCFLVKVI
jgi:hypothetical protein